VSSEDDLVSQELRDRQEAKEAVGLLRELERQCADAENQPDANLEPIRATVEIKLRKAADLLGQGHDHISIIDHLKLQFGAADEINYQLIRQNKVYLVLVARALEDRFNLGPAGGYGGYGFSIIQAPQVKLPIGCEWNRHLNADGR
jgi:hypothetical protein